MAIKLFVTDLDGTLLTPDHKISEENKKAIAKITAKGVIATIATGRMYSSTLPYAKELGVDVPIITYNGAMIKSVSGKVYHADYLDADVVRDVCAYAVKKNLYIHSYDDDELYFREYNDKAKAYEESAGIKGKMVGDKLYEYTKNVPKMLIIADDPSETDGIVDGLNEAFDGRIFAVKSSPVYVEIVKPGVNKANALDILIKKLGFKRSEAMAIGDSNNDLPMLKTAGLSVAMGNAADNVKAVCDDVTGSCTESGVAMAIEKHILKDE